MQQKQELFREPLFRIIVGSGTVLLGLAAVLLHGQQLLSLLCRLLHVMRPLLLGVLFASLLEVLRAASHGFHRICGKQRIPAGLDSSGIAVRRDPAAGAGADQSAVCADTADAAFRAADLRKHQYLQR